MWTSAARAGALAVLVCLKSAAAGPEPGITALAVTPDGQQAVLGSQRGLRVWSRASQTVVETIPTTLEHIHAVAFSADGVHLAVAGGTPADSGELVILDWSRRTPIQHVRPHADLVYDVAWIPANVSDPPDAAGRLALASFDGTVTIVAADTGEVVRRLEGHSRPVTAVAGLPSSQGLVVVTGSIDQTLRVWELRTGKTLRTLHNHTRSVHAVAVRPAAVGPPAGLPLLASCGDDRTVRFWQPTIGRMVRFVRLDAVPLCLAWRPDGRSVLAGCDDGSIVAIDPQTAAAVVLPIRQQGAVLSLAAGPGLTDLVAAGAGGEVIWSAEAELPTPRGP
jgi:WD40 repeat protein